MGKSAIYDAGQIIGDLQIIKRVEDYIYSSSISPQYLVKCSCGNYEIWKRDELKTRKKLICDQCYFKKYKTVRNNEDKFIFNYKGFTGNLSQISEEFNFNYIVLYKRIKKGMSIEEAIETPIKTNKKYEIYYNGKHYNNYKELYNDYSDQIDVSYGVFFRRINKYHYSIEDAIKLKNKSNSRTTFSYNGFTGTLYALCKEFHKKSTTIRRRLDEGMSIEEAMEYNPKRKDKYTINNFTGSPTAICKHFGISYSDVLKEIKNTNKDFVNIVNFRLANRRKIDTYTYNNFQGSIPQICKHFGYTTSSAIDSIRRKIKSGKNFDEAFNEYKIESEKRAKKFNYNGETGSAAYFYKKYNISSNTFLRNLNKGMSIEEIINTYSNKERYYRSSRYPRHYKPKLYEYCGFQGSINEIIEHFNLNVTYGGVKSRLRKGIPIEEAFNNKDISLKDKKIKINSEIKTVEEWCKILDVEIMNVYSRMQKGLSVKESLLWDKGKRLPGKNVITYKNKKYNSYSELEREYNLKSGLLSARLKRGLSLEEAISKEVRERNKIYILDGKEYEGIKDLAKVLNMKDYNVSRLLRKGYKPEDLKNYEEKSTIKHVYTYNNFTGTIQQLIDHFNLQLTYSGIRHRLEKGLSIEEAIEQ